MWVVRGVSGIVTGGVLALALFVLGTAVVGQVRDFPGPGVSTVGWHLGAAVLALGAQWRVDHRRGPMALATAVVVLGVAAVLLWTQWWR